MKKKTLTQLAKEWDVSVTYLSNLKRGVARPSPDMAIKLGKKAGVEPWEMIINAPAHIKRALEK